MWGLRDYRERIMSDEDRSLDARERAALEGALKRCRVLADQIGSILCNEKREFVDQGSLADFYASLQRAADVLGQESPARKALTVGAGVSSLLFFFAVILLLHGVSELIGPDGWVGLIYILAGAYR
jgi:hypothetical protein